MSSSPPLSPFAEDDTSAGLSQPHDSGDYTGDSRLSQLEADVLNEYLKLKNNLDTLAQALASLASNPSAQMSDGLRSLERKTAVVCTALKSSVYGIVLQQQIDTFSEAGEQVESEADG